MKKSTIGQLMLLPIFLIILIGLAKSIYDFPFTALAVIGILAFGGYFCVALILASVND
jgi:hypothetical protein